MKMDKSELNLSYKVKLLIKLLLLIIIFAACEDKPKTQAKKPVKKMVQVVKKIIDKNTTLSKTIQNDGIVVHGARDEELLDAFGLAVSQAIVEDGVSVPDCTALEKTGYLTKDECEEISSKYFGFYDLNEDGSAKKVDDVFKSGIAGDSIKIKDSNINYFDSSGNPLLDNQVEFDEVVATNDDLDFLNGLRDAIPSDKTEMLQNINRKISFLNDINKQEILDVIDKVKNKPTEIKTPVNNIEDDVNTDINNQRNSELEEIRVKYSTALESLKRLKSKHSKTKMDLDLNPNSQSLIDKYNKEELEISNLEQDIDIYLSQLGGG